MSDELPHGQRFSALRFSQLTPEQKAITDRMVSGPAKRVAGPWNAFLRDPALGEILEQLSRYVRFQTMLSEQLYELVVLIAARHLTAQYPWSAHKPAALRSGISAAVIDQIEAGKRPDGLTDEQADVHDFCIELLRTRDVSDSTYARMLARFGEKGIVQITVLLGYYCLNSQIMFVDRMPPSQGSVPLKPIP
jgi:4-carboxymuconolactone decarboxylase